MLSRQAFRSVRAAAPGLRAAVVPARTFAAAAPAAGNEGQPPVSVFGLDGTYASALYTAASKSSTLDPTARAMASLGNVFDKDAKLTHVLSTPTLTAKDKASAASSPTSCPPPAARCK
ncbi:hypothetical protein CDD83_11204 [Cordyceps sp. RAO-2017]|nr:hypothetical protein CDD83_11204 [Cordyceps sp. RAO-2017]